MIRILYLDDRAIDRGLVRATLEREPGRFKIWEVSSRLEYETALARGEADLLLAEPATNGFNGLEVLDLARAADPELPVVLLAAAASLEFAVDGMRKGAADFLLKSPRQLHRLPQILADVYCKRTADANRQRASERQVEDAIHRQLQELILLHSIAMAANAATCEDSLIVNSAQIIQATFQTTNLTFAFIDERSGVIRLHPHFVSNRGQEEFSLPLGEGITGWVAVQGTPRRVADRRLEPDYRVMFPGTLSELCVPLKTSTQLIGVIDLESDQADAFSDADERLLVTLAGQIGTAIERIRLFEQVQRQAGELAGLYNTALATSGVLETESLLRCIYEQVQQLIAPDSFFIVLSEEQTQTYNLALGMENGEVVPAENNLHIPVEDGGLTGWVIRNRKTLCIKDIETEDLPVAPRHRTRPARSWLGVPLVARDRLIGVISVQSFRPHSFKENHRRFLESLAGQVAVALDNTQLFDETRRRLAELESVNKISAAIRSAQTLEGMLSSLMDETLAALGASAGAIWLHDLPRDELSSIVTRGWFTHWTGGVLRRGNHLAWNVLDTGDVFHCHEFAAESNFPDSSHEAFPPGWGGACLPIRAAMETVGVLFLSVQLPRQLSPEEIHLLVTLSEMAGNALHRMRLHEQTERRLQHLGALHMIDMAISASVDLRITLSILLEQATTQLHVDAADIMLFNPFLQTLEWASGRGFRSKPAEGLKLRLGEGYAGRAALEHRIITVTKLSKVGQTSPLPGMWAGEHFVTYYAVPLVAKGQVKGVMNIYHRAPLDPDPEWMNFLETMSTQAAIAIDNASLFDNLQRANIELALAYDATIEGWSRALDLRDHETEGHTRRVVDMTLRLASAMGVKDSELVHIRRGALLHDIGKMGISDTILLKPDKLNTEEWSIIRKHPTYAYELLSPIFYLVPSLDIPYCHHERWDGTGYPRGLQGERIPLAARIFAVADVWDAITSDRYYRKAWPKDKARQYILEQAGKHFDPRVVEVFLKLLGSETLR